MKAYQVYKGDLDKHGRQYYELVGTYLDSQKALDHAKSIAESTPLGDEKLESGFYAKGKCKSWDAVGWERVTVAEFREIEIIE